MKTIKFLILGILLAAGFVALPASTASAALFDNSKQEACQGASLGDENSDACNSETGSEVNKVLATAINIFSMIIGVIAVIMIIIGGLRYITSGGDSAGVNGAKNTILYAIIGLVIVALAQVIVQFVLNRVDQSTKQSNSSIYRLAIADTKQSMVD
ncbi:hypothetical protein KC951_02935 [Candidatus Saccharibacteria bacterium]|nr:hypothetical protein [Candidatus Saccharibacteria bacterium]